MPKQIAERIAGMAEQLRSQADEAERLGKLPDDTAKKLKESGVIRMLQPAEHGGYESHPRDFAEAVMAVARYCGASGWVSGIVGVHPWEMAFCDPKLQEEVWGRNQDTWIASPYAPTGVARPVDGGYVFSGRWQFSSGTDHCDWIFLGGLLGDADGRPVAPQRMLHLVLPRSDYEIVEDSWNVVGLRGTGSKDIVVREAFVPDYRVLDAAKVIEGQAAAEAGRDETVFRMPWSTIFPLGITAAVIGIAEGALDAHVAYQRDRTAAVGGVIKENPYVMRAIGEAAAEIAGARAQLLDNVSRIFDIVDGGSTVSFERRAAGRRDQVRAAWRAVAAVDEIFTRSGGNALRLDQPIQRFWRDAHAGLSHAIHVEGTVYHAAAMTAMGQDVPEALRMMI
ncbi:acyl-CoA dehydrogenase family protein [Streptomyces sp. LHD-70]|uniref:acyl-CoA dehydrogenase family protein n=1 Tax=Streptomyces sp. LHD-70 TaxID=3072140 RepID=UPI00280F966F|nr:acyl-CoA dehydrogenase family protein [Streptomyces sp. LHD-70]MDQ8706021.1 acyl-CoA dehydrogenase family protein [Streptomyces sp. LHD-70]